MIRRPMVSCLVVAMGVGVVAAALGGKPAPKPGDSRQGPPRIVYDRGREVAKIANAEIAESSGLACGRANKDVFWTHNDSGDKARIFAFNGKGEDLAAITVVGASARDWEDMASFTAGGRHILLLGDIGDNNRKRKTCTLYAVVEPRLNPKRRKVRASIRVAQTIHFRYEDGPHNCESVAVDPTDRTIYLVSKVGGRKCKAYAIKWPARASRKSVVAKAVADLMLPTITAMDISPDGLRAVMLTYGAAFEYVRGPKETWAKGFSRAPRQLRMPRRAQGESICYGLDGRTLYLTSEKLPTPLLEVPVKGASPAATVKAAGR